MAPSILGKRQRATRDASALASPPSSRKRRAREPFVHSDNEKDTLVSNSSDPRRKKGSVNIFIDQENTESILQPIVSSPLGASKGLAPSAASKISSEENVEATQLKTPQTSRYRDALSKPTFTTPRHRVSVVGKPLTPRTPRTPPNTHSAWTIYSSARQLFAPSADPGPLVGRGREKQELNAFLEQRIEANLGGCIYVSGPPGTGKSAFVSEVCDEIGTRKTLKMVYINCLTMKTSRDVHNKLLERLFEDRAEYGADGVELLRGAFTSKNKPGELSFVVILDEIDHLLTADLELLYSIFEWSLHRNSRLILVGIANALDLTDRFLPRLKARNVKPHLLPFLPYTSPQIATVITTRLQSLLPKDGTSPKDYVPFLHPAAIQLCAKKVASQTGDLRKAFDLIRRTVDLIESETTLKHQQKIEQEELQSSPTKTALIENMNLSSPASDINERPRLTLASSLGSLTPLTAPRATIAHVAKVASAALGNSTAQRLQNLNLQQKAALCTLVVLEKRRRVLLRTNDVYATPKKRMAAPTVKELFYIYSMLCKRENVLHPLTSTEFRDIITSLETMGLVNEVDGKNSSFTVKVPTPSRRGTGKTGGSGAEEKQMASCVTEKELLGCITGAGGDILKNLLSSE